MKKTKKTLAALAITSALMSYSNAGLVAYFPLDGAAGATTTTIDDIKDYNNHGVTDGTANGATFGTWVNDATRGSVLFSPDGNRFLAGTQDIDLTTGFTWSLWVNVDSITGSSDSIIGTRNGSWHKLTPSRGIDGSGFVDFADGDYNIADDTWHHIALVGTDNGTGNPGTVDVSLYIDGVFIDNDTTAASLTYNGQMEIGGSTRFSEYATVLMDDIAIWNHALPLTTIQALAAGTAPVPEPSTTALLFLGGFALLIRRRR